MTVLDQHTRSRLQTRIVIVLMLSTAIGAMGATIGIAATPLLAEELSGSTRAAGLAQTFQVFGTAVAAYLVARVMGSRGRRSGLVLGYVVGGVGAVVAVLSGVIGSVTVLFAGAVLLGSISAVGQAARYAATDLAADDARARALSLVVWSTTVGAVAGPNLTGPAAAAATRLALPPLTGPFVFAVVAIVLAAVVVAAALRPDPLLIARAHATGDGRPHPLTGVEPLVSMLRGRPILVTAMVALAGAHAVMVSVMVMTPLHMADGGARLPVIGFVISIHVFGMFAFSPVVGWCADAWGRARTVWAGGIVLLVALALCGSAPVGDSWNITLGLFLLGLGWSFATVAGSALVADHAPPEDRTRVQGVSDMVMSLTAAAGGGVSGFVVSAFDFRVLNVVAALLAVVVLGAAVAVWRHDRMEATRHTESA